MDQPNAPAAAPEQPHPAKLVFGGLKRLRLAVATGADDDAAFWTDKLVHRNEDGTITEAVDDNGMSAFMVAAWSLQRDEAVLERLARAGADTGRRSTTKGLSVFMSLARDACQGRCDMVDLARFLTRYAPHPHTPPDGAPDPWFGTSAMPEHIAGLLRYPMDRLHAPAERAAMEQVVRHLTLCHRVPDLERWARAAQSTVAPNALALSDLWTAAVTDRVRAVLEGECAGVSAAPSARPTRRM